MNTYIVTSSSGLGMGNGFIIDATSPQEALLKRCELVRGASYGAIPPTVLNKTWYVIETWSAADSGTDMPLCRIHALKLRQSDVTVEYA